jgi:soluble lytic murein transglycosylase-like protein
MSVILREKHEFLLKQVKRKALMVQLVLAVMLVLALVYPFVDGVRTALVRESYRLVRFHLAELRCQYVLLEILRNKPLTIGQALEVADVVIDESKASKVPVHLVLGLLGPESNFNPNAVSPVGARGLMQVMPETWRYYVDRSELKNISAMHNTAMNVRVGIRYLGDLLKEKGDVRKALGVYGGFITKSPTQYVNVVMAKAEHYKAQIGETYGSDFAREEEREVRKKEDHSRRD